MTALGPGVRVKAIKSDWYWEDSGIPAIGPIKNSIWTISKLEERSGRMFIYLSEWPVSWHHFLVDYFVPLDGNEDISDLIAALKKGSEQRDIERKEIIEIAEAIRTGAAEFVREAK